MAASARSIRVAASCAEIPLAAIERLNELKCNELEFYPYFCIRCKVMLQVSPNCPTCHLVMVEKRRIELPTSALRTQRSPS